MDAQDGVADDWDMISPCVNFAYSVLTSTPGIHVGQLCEYIDSNCAMLVLTRHGVTNSSNNLYYFPEMCAASEPLVAERQALINAGWPSGGLWIYDFTVQGVTQYGLGMRGDIIVDHVRADITGGMEYLNSCYVFAGYCNSSGHAFRWLPGYATNPTQGYIGWTMSPTIYSICSRLLIPLIVFRAK